jgi:hypothetical protein
MLFSDNHILCLTCFVKSLFKFICNYRTQALKKHTRDSGRKRCYSRSRMMTMMVVMAALRMNYVENAVWLHAGRMQVSAATAGTFGFVLVASTATAPSARSSTCCGHDATPRARRRATAVTHLGDMARTPLNASRTLGAVGRWSGWKQVHNISYYGHIINNRYLQ